jgi:hypothetical protein
MYLHPASGKNLLGTIQCQPHSGQLSKTHPGLVCDQISNVANPSEIASHHHLKNVFCVVQFPCRLIILSLEAAWDWHIIDLMMSDIWLNSQQSPLKTCSADNFKDSTCMFTDILLHNLMWNLLFRKINVSLTVCANLVVTKFSGRMGQGTGSNGSRNRVEGWYFWVGFTKRGQKWLCVPGLGSTFPGRGLMASTPFYVITQLSNVNIFILQSNSFSMDL